MSVTLRLPSVLKVAVGADQVRVTGGTVREALDAACASLPNLRQHILLASGELRPHVLCFHNQTNTRWVNSMAVPLSDGDTITIFQAVSGG